MKINLKKLVPLVLIKTFVIGNCVAMFLGTWPVNLPQWSYNPSEKETIGTLTQLISAKQDDPAPAAALGTLYFLHNELDRAESAVQSAFIAYPDDPQTCALYQAIQAKKAGAMWDFAFGQIKLRRLKTALMKLNTCAQNAPDALDVQIFALATFASVPKIGSNAATGLTFAQHMETRLHHQQWADAPPALTASAWLAIARVYLYFAQHDATQKALWKIKATHAWNAYQALNTAPEWLTNEREYVSTTLVKV